MYWVTRTLNQHTDLIIFVWTDHSCFMIATVTSPIRRVKDIKKFFFESGFKYHQEQDFHKVILGERRLGNTKFVSLL